MTSFSSHTNNIQFNHLELEKSNTISNKIQSIARTKNDDTNIKHKKLVLKNISQSSNFNVDINSIKINSPLKRNSLIRNSSKDSNLNDFTNRNNINSNLKNKSNELHNLFSIKNSKIKENIYNFDCFNNIAGNDVIDIIKNNTISYGNFTPNKSNNHRITSNSNNFTNLNTYDSLTTEQTLLVNTNKISNSIDINKESFFTTNNSSYINRKNKELTLKIYSLQTKYNDIIASLNKKVFSLETENKNLNRLLKYYITHYQSSQEIIKERVNENCRLCSENVKLKKLLEIQKHNLQYNSFSNNKKRTNITQTNEIKSLSSNFNCNSNRDNDILTNSNNSSYLNFDVNEVKIRNQKRSNFLLSYQAEYNNSVIKEETDSVKLNSINKDINNIVENITNKENFKDDENKEEIKSSISRNNSVENYYYTIITNKTNTNKNDSNHEQPLRENLLLNKVFSLNGNIKNNEEYDNSSLELNINSNMNKETLNNNFSPLNSNNFSGSKSMKFNKQLTINMKQCNNNITTSTRTIGNSVKNNNANTNKSVKNINSFKNLSNANNPYKSNTILRNSNKIKIKETISNTMDLQTPSTNKNKSDIKTKNKEISSLNNNNNNDNKKRPYVTQKTSPIFESNYFIDKSKTQFYSSIMNYSERQLMRKRKRERRKSLLSNSEIQLHNKINNQNVIKLFNLVENRELFIKEMRAASSESLCYYSELLGDVIQDYMGALKLIIKIKQFIFLSQKMSTYQLDSSVKDVIMTCNKVLDTERTSIFIHDPLTKMLKVYYGEGTSKNKIKFLDNEGVAGWVFSNEVPLILNDPYSDSRFNKKVDSEMNFNTRSLICLPLKDVTGKVFGVLEAINKRSGMFLKDDEELMNYFSELASSLLSNSMKFQSERSISSSLKTLILYSIKIPQLFRISTFISFTEEVLNKMFKCDNSRILVFLSENNKEKVLNEILRYSENTITQEEVEFGIHMKKENNEAHSKSCKRENHDNLSRSNKQTKFLYHISKKYLNSYSSNQGLVGYCFNSGKYIGAESSTSSEHYNSLIDIESNSSIITLPIIRQDHDTTTVGINNEVSYDDDKNENNVNRDTNNANTNAIKENIFNKEDSKVNKLISNNVHFKQSTENHNDFNKINNDTIETDNVIKDKNVNRRIRQSSFYYQNNYLQIAKKFLNNEDKTEEPDNHPLLNSDIIPENDNVLNKNNNNRARSLFVKNNENDNESKKDNIKDDSEINKSEDINYNIVIEKYSSSKFNQNKNIEKSKENEYFINNDKNNTNDSFNNITGNSKHKTIKIDLNKNKISSNDTCAKYTANSYKQKYSLSDNTVSNCNTDDLNNNNGFVIGVIQVEYINKVQVKTPPSEINFFILESMSLMIGYWISNYLIPK